MLEPDLLSKDAIISGTYKVFGTAFEEVSTRVGKKGSWTDEEFTVKASSRINNNNNNDQNYRLELAIPGTK